MRRVMLHEHDARLRKARTQLKGKIGFRERADERYNVDIFCAQIREAKALRHGFFRQGTGATTA